MTDADKIAVIMGFFEALARDANRYQLDDWSDYCGYEDLPDEVGPKRLQALAAAFANDGHLRDYIAVQEQQEEVVREECQRKQEEAARLETEHQGAPKMGSLHQKTKKMWDNCLFERIFGVLRR